MNNNKFSTIRTVRDTVSANIVKSLNPDIEKAKKYNVGEISQITGLQKQADGSWKPPKGSSNSSVVSEIEKRTGKSSKQIAKETLNRFADGEGGWSKNANKENVELAKKYSKGAISDSEFIEGVIKNDKSSSSKKIRYRNPNRVIDVIDDTFKEISKDVEKMLEDGIDKDSAIKEAIEFYSDNMEEAIEAIVGSENANNLENFVSKTNKQFEARLKESFHEKESSAQSKVDKIIDSTFKEISEDVERMIADGVSKDRAIKEAIEHYSDTMEESIEEIVGEKGAKYLEKLVSDVNKKFETKLKEKFKASDSKNK